jgi:FdhE protein
MTGSSSSDQATRIRHAVDRMRKELPQLSEIFDAFEDVSAEQEAFKAMLPNENEKEYVIDPGQFRDGLPLLRKEDFTVDFNYLRQAADRIIPAMMKGFPSIKPQLELLEKALRQKDSFLLEPLAVMPVGTDAELETLATRLHMDSGILKFTMLQLVKPFAIKQAENAALTLDSLNWQKGYCPVCGSWPELGFLEGKEGRRWLRCSFCSHEWPFMRTKCPFCETDDHEKMELYFSEERSYERAELCYQCMRYLVSIDLRDLADDVVREVASLGLVYLDILAQEKGFSPASMSATLLASG